MEVEWLKWNFLPSTTFTKCKHKVKKTKLQDVEIKNFVLFIET